MTAATSNELMSHAAVTGGEPLTASTCERRRRAIRRAIHIGQVIDQRAAVPGFCIIHPVFVALGVMLLVLVITDIAIMVAASA